MVGFRREQLGMTMRACVVLGCAAAALAGCNPPHPHGGRDTPLKTISALDCPDRQGDLSRKTAAADGKSCVYATAAGARVTLQLISLDGRDARTALAPLEAQLKAELPAPHVGPGSGGSGVATAQDKDRVDINLPGIHIHSTGDGHADVDAAGVHVNADDGDGRSGNDKAVVTVKGGAGHGGVTVNADDSGAQIRVDERGSGLRFSYILASDAPGPHGYRMAGYEARGPAAGPLAVASVLAASEDHDELRHDLRALVRRNVGG